MKEGYPRTVRSRPRLPSSPDAVALTTDAMLGASARYL